MTRMLRANLDKYNISPLAKSLLQRLLGRNIMDRYRVYQALAHPWITRNLAEKVPPTQNEEHLQMDCEIKLKHAQLSLLVMSIAQHGKTIKKKQFS